MMSQSRCTLSVRGLDCPNEVGTLRAALEGSPGIHRLGFDLINGLMTVDYAEGAADPVTLVRLIRERAGMEAALVGLPESTVAPSSWWSRNGRLVATAGSGLALGLGLLVAWLGPRTGLDATLGERLARACFGLSVAIGGAWLYPRAIPSLGRFRLDLHGLMGLAILGAIGLGQWDEAATVAFLFGLSETLESLSLDPARPPLRRLARV